MIDRATRTSFGARCAFCIATTLLAFPLRAQDTGDSARITYHTRDIVFVAAGRDAGLRVGDTIQVAADSGAVAAVVLSVARASASARLLAAARITAGATAAFRRRPALVADPRPDPTPAARDSIAPARLVALRAPPRLTAPPRVSGTLQLEQVGASGGSSRLSTSQTIGMLSLRALAARGVELRLRTTSRRRGGGSAALPGTPDFSTTVYEAELLFGGRDSRWQAAVGRFVPRGAMALGYIDGARIEWRAAPGQAVGAVLGFVPQPLRLRPANDTRRAGAYWTFTAARAVSGSLAAAADWSDGARRRTQLASQGLLAPSRAWSLSWYADADLGAPWDSLGARLTNANATLRFRLPAGVRASVGGESHQAVRLWDSFTTGDTLPLPGRLTGWSAGLGRDIAGFAVDAAGARLSRTGDPTATLRGSLTLSRRGLFLSGSRQHGDLLDYSSLMARVILPRRLPVHASLGFLYAATKLSGGASFHRAGLRPEIAGRLSGGWSWSAGGDIGRYAGRTTTWLHAGASYRFQH